jgi:hypothetical protein
MASDYSIDAVNLPFAPRSVRHTSTSNTKNIPLADYLIVKGSKAEVLVWEGRLIEAGSNQAVLETNYVLPIRNKRSTEVTLQGPSWIWWDNTNWILADADFRMERGKVRSFRYKFKFLRAGTMLVI